jgi:predicted RND superfamily exporter protein
MIETTPAGSFACKFVDWTLRRGTWIWAVALLIALPATWRTATLYLHIHTDLEELLPRDAPSVRAIDELRTRMPGLQYLGVVVDAGRPENLPAAERFIDDLAGRVRAYPKTVARSVRTGTGEERAFLDAHAPLYIDALDLETIRQRVERRRDFDVAHATGASLDDDEVAPPLDFHDIEKKYSARAPDDGKRAGDRYSDKELHLTLLLIEVGEFETGTKNGKELLERIKADVAALGGLDAYAPGMRHGYAGDVAISVEETQALVSDLSVASLLVIVAVVGALVLYYRWWRSVIALVPPLLIATVYAFSLASLPPFGVTSLNSNTAFLGTIIVGNGINFGIVLLARYVEERRRGATTRDALVTSVGSTRAGTLAAALAAGVSYASLIITQFRGFRQFGILGGIGMVLSWLVAFVLMPPLIAWLDRDGSAARPRREGTAWMAPLTRFVERFRMPVLLAGTVLTLGAAAKVSGFRLDQLESDFSKLRRADTWETGEGYWGRRMDDVLGEYLTPTVVLTDSPEQARVIAQRLRQPIRGSAAGEMIASVRTLDDVLPLEQPRKIAEIATICDEMTPAMRAAVAPERRQQLDRLLGNCNLRPIALADLPRTFTTALVERDGSAGRAVLVFPRPSQALWEGRSLGRFVEELRRTAAFDGAPSARVAGSLPLSADILASIRRDGPLASAAALLGVIVVVLLMTRARAISAYVIGSLVVGVAWMAAASMVLGIKINFANFIAFPITFGIGVDYAVNIVSRYVQDGRRDVAGAVRGTGSAVALCSATTIIGYSSLLVAENRALFLFGLVAVLGEIACLVAAVTLLPSALLLFDRRQLIRAELPSSGNPASSQSTNPPA